MTSFRPCSAAAFPLADARLQGLTPADVFGAQRDLDRTFWLDSAACAPLREGWSYLGANPVERVEVRRHHVVAWRQNGSETIAVRSPLSYLLGLLGNRRAVSLPASRPGPPFCGGWVGYLGYESAGSRRSEDRDSGLSCPDSSFGLFDAILAYSHAEQRWWAGATLLSATSPARCQREAKRKVEHLLAQIAPMSPADPRLDALPALRAAASDFTPCEYRAVVRRALEYIAAGDIYQVNLAQRLTIPWELSHRLLYWRLRQQSPAGYGAYLGAGLVGRGQTLCSISPELFLRLRDGEVVTRPIKGTRPRGLAGGPDDVSARRGLEESAKERAELNMIVDLERNDLGRVCEYGSVRVVSPGEIEELPTLYHRVATVAGRLHSRFGVGDLIRAAFPGGSVTGAPKIRAMEIIRELEPSPRGPYCGAIGWLGLDGNMELSVAIRTALCDGPRRLAHYHAGSGIVADSDPEGEYQETLHKAAAFFRAANAEPVTSG